MGGGGSSANQISSARNSVQEGYFWSGFRPIRFFHIADSTNLPNQSDSKKSLSTKVTVRIYSLSRREESRKHKLSACLYVRTSLIDRRKR